MHSASIRIIATAIASWPAILDACKAAGVCWYAVEQDDCYRDPFDCLKSSYAFLSGQGL